MSEHTALPTDVGVGLENVRLAPHPDLPHITVLSVHQGWEINGERVPSGAAWLSPDERRTLARELDPDRHPSADNYEQMGAQLEEARRHAAALETEVRRLTAELAPARYVLGDRDCLDGKCDQAVGGGWCPHVEHRVATLADLDDRDAEIGHLRSERSTLERALADLWAGREVVPADGGLAEVARLMKRTCARCGAPVPADRAVCETACAPTVAKGGAS